MTKSVSIINLQEHEDIAYEFENQIDKYNKFKKQKQVIKARILLV